MSKLVTFNTSGGSKLYNRPKLTTLQIGPKSTANRSIAVAAQDHQVPDRRLIRPSYFGNHNIPKISNSEQFHQTGPIETRESISFRQKRATRVSSMITANSKSVVPKPRKRVTFQDQLNVTHEFEGQTCVMVNNNNKDVIAGPIPSGQNNEAVPSAPAPIPAAVKKNGPEKLLVYAVQGVTSIETPTTPAPPCNEFADPADMSSNILFTVDMSGFTTENITMYVKGRRLIIEGVQQKEFPFVRTRRTQEVLTLPQGVQCDNLKIARDQMGILLFELAWQF